MKRLNLIVSIVLIFILSVEPVDCFASEAYYSDLVEAEITSQERIDYFNKMLKTERVRTYLHEINSYENVFASLSYDEGSYQICNLTFYCFNNDYVAFLYAPNGVSAINFISKSNEEVVGKVYVFQASLTDLNVDGSLNAVLQGQVNDFPLNNVVTKNDITYYEREYWSGVTGCSTANDGRNGVVRSDVPIFKTEDDAILYLDGNDIKPLYNNLTLTDYSSDLYFKDLRIIPHVDTIGSNSSFYNDTYFSFLFELTDYAKSKKDDLILIVQNYYVYSENDGKNTFNSSLCANKINFGGSSVKLNLYAKSLGSLNAFEQNYNKKDCSVSRLTLYFHISYQGRIGPRYEFTFDFLDFSTSCSYFNPETKEDDNGNISFVKDGNGNISYIQIGSTEISKDYYSQEGDKYYYTDNNGSKKEITENDYNNSSASIGDINISVGDGSGNYININPVDFNQFVRGMEDMLKQFDTKGGLFLLIKDVFAMFPPEITVIVVGAISAITIVSIICILRR